MFEKLTLIGIGLIGSSIARVAQKRKATSPRPWPSRRRKSAADAGAHVLGARHIYDVVEDDIGRRRSRAATASMLCVPVGVYADVMRQIVPHLAKGCDPDGCGLDQGQRDEATRRRCCRRACS
jgi:cyclohexadieny/prephenate dehydrogenase